MKRMFYSLFLLLPPPSATLWKAKLCLFLFILTFVLVVLLGFFDVHLLPLAHVCRWVLVHHHPRTSAFRNTHRQTKFRREKERRQSINLLYVQTAGSDFRWFCPTDSRSLARTRGSSSLAINVSEREQIDAFECLPFITHKQKLDTTKHSCR